MRENILTTLLHSLKLVISPDIDGFISSRLLQEWNPNYVVVGTYDKNVLTLAEGVDPIECLFLDCDMNRSDLVSIGNHMRLTEGDNMSTKSFNPNVFFNVNKYSDKYPFATAFLISAVIESTTSPQNQLHMAYADSTYKNLVNYRQNMENWLTRMEHTELTKVFNLSKKDVDSLIALEGQYPKQGFVSKKFGKKRYIEEMNSALKTYGLNSETLVSGKKFVSDKVGKATVLRYSSDMISYAEIYGGEYSVTYDQEKGWA
jgi:hypothetical protein